MFQRLYARLQNSSILVLENLGSLQILKRMKERTNERGTKNDFFQGHKFQRYTIPIA